MKHVLKTLIAALAAATLAGAAHAADAVRIGVIYPLTGNAASAGNSAKTRSSWVPKSSMACIPNSRAAGLPAATA